MIEVEVRGWLSEQQAKVLEVYLQSHGRHLQTQDREMILLKDGYPGYDIDFEKRTNDIRFKKTLLRPAGATDGQAKSIIEIVVKERASDGNVARHEYTYPVAVDSIEALIPLARAFGATKALWMRRDAEIYELDGIEWGIVRAISRDRATTKLHFEAELAVETQAAIPAAQARLEAAVTARGLTILTGADHRAFIEELERTVNQPLDLTEG